MVACGGMWCHMMAYGAIWWHMVTHCDIWQWMFIYGDIWWYMGIYDVIWWYMMMYSDIWCYMVLYGDIWLHGYICDLGWSMQIASGTLIWPWFEIWTSQPDWCWCQICTMAHQQSPLRACCRKSLLFVRAPTIVFIRVTFTVYYHLLGSDLRARYLL